MERSLFVSQTAFMLTGPSTKITNLGALKIAIEAMRFLMHLVFVLMFSFVTEMIVNLLV